MAAEHVQVRQATDAQWTKRELRDRCRRLKNAALRRNLASEGELQSLFPSESDSYNKHIHAYALLQRVMERERFVTHGSEYASRKLLAALDREPIEVELLGGTSVHVHPKSEAALRWFADAYFWLNWFNVRAEAIHAQADNYEERKERGEEPLPGVSRPISVTEELVIETNRRAALILWAACHEGPGLPWAYGEPAPDEPADESWLDLSSIDVTRIERAFHEVNVGRLAFLPKPKERGKGITPEVFFSQRIKVTGRPMSELRRGRDLASQVAEVALAGFREDEA